MSDPIDALREAVRFSPDNVPLRRHLAESLMKTGAFGEAEAEYRAALSHAANDIESQVGLASAFRRQGKMNEALVLLEQIDKSVDRADVKILLARVLASRGDLADAHAMYRAAVDLDPEVADAGLAEEVGYEVYVDESPDQRVRLRHEQTDIESTVEMVKPEAGFADVGGMEELKEQIRLKVIYPIANAELFAQYGKSVGGGVLMYGPPGCGKTHLARATAGEVDAGFLSVGIEDILDMYLGNSEQKLHAVFEQARSNTPCVLFFDEVDALGARRGDLKHSGGRMLVNQFLTELDGLNKSNDGLLILAATNAPWTLDVAFRRPGRFDEILFVPPPNEPARVEILKLLLAGKPTEDIKFEKIAAKSKEFSGADLKSCVDRAIEAKLQQAMKTGQPEPIRTGDLLATVKKHRPSCREWLASARNHAMYGNESGLYDDVLAYLDLKK